MTDVASVGHPTRTLTFAGLLVGPATIFVALLLLAPLVFLVGLSFSNFNALYLSVEGATLDNYLNFFADAYYRNVMVTTLLVAVLSTLLCLAIAFPISYRLARMQARYKGVLIILLILPLFISGTIRTIGWMILFTRNGLLNQGLAFLAPGVATDIMYTPLAVLIGSVSILLPFMILTLQSVIEGIDTRLEEAAGGMGAEPVTVFWRIIWPLALPGISIGCILCFTMSMNTYATAVLLGGPQFHMMAPLIYYEFTVSNNWSLASVAAVLLLIVNLGLAYLLTRGIRRRAGH